MSDQTGIASQDVIRKLTGTNDLKAQWNALRTMGVEPCQAPDGKPRVLMEALVRAQLRSATGGLTLDRSAINATKAR